MSNDDAMTFKRVKSVLQKSNDPKALDALDKLFGAAILLSPIFFGGAGVFALTLIAPKNELIRLVKSALQRFEPEMSFADRVARVEAAYCLSTFAAFFIALDQTMPDVAKLLDLSAAEKLEIVKETVGGAPEGNGIDALEVVIALPPVVDTISNSKALRENLYKLLCKGLVRFLSGLSSWEDLKERDREAILKRLSELPTLAEATFVGQHLQLTTEFPEYLSWYSFRDNTEQLTRLSNIQRSNDMQQALLTQAATDLDVGLQRLHDLAAILYSKPERQITPRSSVISQELHRRYVASISRPIIRGSEPQNVDLTYPSKSDIFIPQAFKALTYDSHKRSIEKERTWNMIEALEDIGQFLLSYLQSPSSLRTPIVVLGQPGSGKSLLTEMLAAQLAWPNFNTVRVELRDIDADDDFQTQVEKQIQSAIGRSVSWPDYSSELAESPPLIILDGFDELLQASGRIHSNYIDNVHRFQLREFDLMRPVRILITSRIALINRARLPLNTTVIRLLEFDETRQSNWASIWNRENKSFFERTGTRAFQVPRTAKLATLAEQPLLLLMLALYDSEGNSLSLAANLDQTLLYHNLLARFIEREQSKGDSQSAYDRLNEADREALIENELDRLGVAAIGMFNRNSVHLRKNDLESDLQYFKPHSAEPSAYATLTGAELVVGSFFFVHEATTESGDTGEHQGSIEFLHNTFGEFLTADFILRRVMHKIAPIQQMRGVESLAAPLRSELEHMNSSLASCLLHTPLYTRPVIVSMLQEWLRHVARRRHISEVRLFEAIDAYVREQLRFCALGLETNLVGPLSPTAPGSPLVRSAILSINLVLLRTVLVTTPFTFDIDIPAVTGRCLWTTLTHIWQAVLSPEELVGLSAVVSTSRDMNRVTLQKRPGNFAEQPGAKRLETIRAVGDVLGDDAVSALSGLLLWESTGEAAAEDLAILRSTFVRAGLDEDYLNLRYLWMEGFDWRRADDIGAITRSPRPFSPGQFASLSAAAPVRTLSVRDALELRPHLGTAQTEPVIFGPIHQARVLLELNSIVEPRFVEHVISFVALDLNEYRNHRLPALSKQECVHFVRVVIRSLMPFAALPSVANFLDWIRRAGLSSEDFDLNESLAIAVLAAIWGDGVTCENYLVQARVLLEADPSALMDCSVDSLAAIAGWLADTASFRRRAALDSARTYISRQLISWAESFVRSDRHLPPAELCLPILRLMSKGLYSRSRLRQRVLEDAYAYPAPAMIRLISMLHEHGDTSGGELLVQSIFQRRDHGLRDRVAPNTSEWLQALENSLVLIDLPTRYAAEAADALRWLEGLAGSPR